jgi:hypothetical protein
MNVLFYLSIISLHQSKVSIGTQDSRIDQGNEEVWVVLHPLDRIPMTEGVKDYKTWDPLGITAMSQFLMI